MMMTILWPKKYLVGIEIEFFILDNNGRISNNSDILIHDLAKLGIDAKKECAKNMIEIISKPTEIMADSMQNLLDKIKILTEVAEKNDMKIFYCGTYPGSFHPKMREDLNYKIKEKIFGIKTWEIAGRCIGFHCHYTLISGIFSKITKNIKMLLHFEKNQAFVDSYNLLIALDPVFSTFMQSSPFYQGKFYGKDSRMMFYRGNDFFGVDGLYSNFQEFGTLPEYKHVITEIMYDAESRFEKWSKMMERVGITAHPQRAYNSIYDVNWGPIKVNPIGTFELRGMDMNRFELLASCAVLMKYALESIHKRNIRVFVDEIGIKEPFKIDGKTLYLPPFKHLESVLQKKSAIKGMDDNELREYCNSFLKFASKILPSHRKKFLNLFKKMVSSKTTVSDEIIDKARKMGVGNTIDNENAANLALEISDKVFFDIDKTERMILSDLS